VSTPKPDDAPLTPLERSLVRAIVSALVRRHAAEIAASTHVATDLSPRDANGVGRSAFAE
jgi:hypothetical protein